MNFPFPPEREQRGAVKRTDPGFGMNAVSGKLTNSALRPLALAGRFGTLKEKCSYSSIYIA